MAEGYTEARKQIVRREETSRREFIEDLFRVDADVGRLVERAELFGLDMGRPHQVALAAPTGRLGHADTVISTLERAVVHRCRGPLRPGFGAPTASVTVDFPAEVAERGLPRGEGVESGSSPVLWRIARGERLTTPVVDDVTFLRGSRRGEALIGVLRRRSQPWVLVAGRRSGWMCHRPSPLRFVQIAADCERGLREAAHGNHAPSESRRQGLRVAVFMRSDLPTLGESHRGTAWVADVGRGPASGQAARRATRMGRSGETCI